MDAYILPLFVHLDPLARQVTEFLVHVVAKSLARLADYAENGVLADLEHSAHRIDRRSFTERGED